MSLTISRRLGLLVAVASLVSIAAIIVQLMALRDSLYVERKQAIERQVQSALAIVKGFGSQEQNGTLTRAEAQERARQVLRSIRFGENDYFFVHSFDGVTLVHAKPQLEGKNRWNERDPNGVYQIRGDRQVNRSWTNFRH